MALVYGPAVIADEESIGGNPGQFCPAGGAHNIGNSWNFILVSSSDGQ